MDDPTIKFDPGAAARATHRRRLASALHKLAAQIEADELESPPHAILMVLASEDGHEVTCMNMTGDDIFEAAHAAHREYDRLRRKRWGL